jgi:hypothetical protein
MGEIAPFPKRGVPLRLISSAPLPPRGGDDAGPPAIGSLPATGGRRGEYALGDVARDLSLSHFAVRSIIAKLRALAEHDGMPLPRTPRVVEGRAVTGPDSIYCRSRWDAGEFDAWLDSRSPSGPAAAGMPHLAPPIRAAMQQRALEIARA